MNVRLPTSKASANLGSGDRGPAAVSPAGDFVVFGRGDGIVEIAEVKAKKWTRQLKLCDAEISYLDMTDAGKSLTAVTRDGEVYVVDMTTQKPSKHYKLNKIEANQGGKFAVTADGKYLAYHEKTKQKPQPPLGLRGPAGNLGVYDLANGKPLWQVEEPSMQQRHQRLSLSQDNKLLAAVEVDKAQVALDYQVGIWEIQTGKKIGTLGSKDRETNVNDVRSICLCDKANVLAIGLANGHIELWDLKTSKHLLDLTGHKGPVEALALSPDGHTLASGGSEGTIVLWDLRAATAQKEKAKAKGFPLAIR